MFLEILIIFIAVIVGYNVGRYKSLLQQNTGEALFVKEIKNELAINGNDFHILNNITFKFPDGSTTQIDHVIISRYGVFVIETKHYSGWLYAGEHDKQWTQVLFKKKFRFQNPILQNYKHLKAIESLLDFLPSGSIHSVVVFTGNAEFKTSVPEGVFTPRKFINYYNSIATEVMSENRLQFCIGRIERLRMKLTKETDIEHINNLQSRFGEKNI